MCVCVCVCVHECNWVQLYYSTVQAYYVMYVHFLYHVPTENHRKNNTTDHDITYIAKITLRREDIRLTIGVEANP